MRASGSGWEHPQSLPGNPLGSPGNPLGPPQTLCLRAAARDRACRAANEHLGAAVGVHGNVWVCKHNGGDTGGCGSTEGVPIGVCDSQSECAHTRVHGRSTGVGVHCTGVGVHRLGVCVCAGGCGCAQHTAAPTCLGAMQGCSPQNILFSSKPTHCSPNQPISLASLPVPPPDEPFLPLNQPFFPQTHPVLPFPPLPPPYHAVPLQWSAAGSRKTAPSASARGTTGSWGSTVCTGCCSGCGSCGTPASPTLRNSSDPPLPHTHTLYPLCFPPPPTTHSLKCWEMVLGCASAGNKAPSSDPFCCQEQLQVLEEGHLCPPPPPFGHLCPPHVGTCLLFTPNAFPPTPPNPLRSPFSPYFCPLPTPPAPDTRLLPPPCRHAGSPSLTPVLPLLCCLGFPLPEGGLRKPASA